MTGSPEVAQMSPDLSSLDQAPLPMVMAEGAMHIVRYANPAFCRLVKKTKDELVGRPFGEMLPADADCLAMLERVYHTGTSEIQDYTKAGSVPWSYTIWPVTQAGRTAGVMIQTIEAASLYEKAVAMNEALILGSLRQHELTEFANWENSQLQTEVDERKQRERDAQMLTSEVSHRIKNNLQIVIGLIAHEARRAAAPCVQGYEAMQSRIRAIAELYDLISQSSWSESIRLDVYLKEIAETMSASLLEKSSSIKLEVEAEALEISPNRAVSFGLLVNELVTNAIKHAFPDRSGRVLLRVRQAGDQIELDVADNGVGIADDNSTNTARKQGSNYVAIFVRQLGGTFSVSGPEESGTTVRVRIPAT
jgi:two-component sensor histidine kinase